MNNFEKLEMAMTLAKIAGPSPVFRDVAMKVVPLGWGPVLDQPLSPYYQALSWQISEDDWDKV